jgi:tetratricopeptide (TPR) repeat protein
MKERHDLEFVEWISSSQWDVESQLQALQDRYRETTIPTLQWAHKMDDFQLWLRSDLTHECKERVLWVVGPPGVGKSTLAAYLLEFTRALDQDAVTAFFFVRSEQRGLASPLKVVCTLAHQLSLLVPEFRQYLDKLKSAGFVVKDELGINYLFKKLLLDPLRTCKRPIHVILDGVDEVDMKKDPRDPYRESSEILFDCLYSMPSSRLLFLSRPQSVPSLTTKHSFAVTSIGLDQNKADIEVYVNQQLLENPKLKERFKKADVDPVQFFITHSNGIFLWVVLVLRHLSKASGKLFNSFVLGISETPTDMTELYQKILERFSNEDREWVKEIFYWIIGPKRQLSIDELQCAVEFCLQDELNNFRDFVLRKCGSLFIVTRHGDAKDTNVEYVQTVHETLRAFIMNPICPHDLHVTTESAHTHITYKGLAFLSTDDVYYKPLYRYLVAEWHYHLVNTTLRNHDQDILCGLYRLFHSADLKKWVHDDIISHWGSEDTENETPIEKKALRDVHKWLARYEVGEGTVTRPEDSELLLNAIQWREAAVQDIDKLGESVAKAAALIWLFNELESKKTIIAAFKLGTGYYWTRENRSGLSDREELQKLFDTDFAALIEWAGGFKRERLNERNLGIARVTLTQWVESHTLKKEMAVKSKKAMWEEIHEFHCPLHRSKSSPGVVSYSADSESTARDWMILTSPIVEVTGSGNTLEALQIQVQSDPTAWTPLGTAHRAAGDLDKAVIAYRQAIKSRPYEFNAHHMLAETYWVQGEYEWSIRTLEGCTQQGFDDEAFASIGWSYIHLDEKKAVEYFHRAMESNPHFAPAYKGLGDVYNVRGDHDKMIEIYQTKLRESPTTSFLWSGLGEAYLAKKMYQEAIDAYRTAVNVNPRDRWAWSCLGDVFRLNNQYDEAIEAFWTSIEGNPRDSWPWKGLAESYREKGDLTRAIAIYTHALRRLRDYSLFVSVGMLFKERGNYDKAIGSFKQAVERTHLKRRVLFAYLNLPTSHLFSNFPLISLDSNLPKFLLWTHLVECLRAHQDKDLLMHHDVELHAHKDAESPDRIIEEAIREYRKAIQACKHNRLLWVYSAYSASKGFPPFEQMCDLPPEILWAMLAEAYKAASRYNEAVEAYEEAVKLLPTNKWLRTSLSEMYEKVGKPEKATEARVAAENVNGLYQRRFSYFGHQPEV